VGVCVGIATLAVTSGIKFHKTVNARAILLKKRDEAAKFPNLAKLAKSKSGIYEMNTYWMTMVSGAAAPYTAAQKKTFLAAFNARQKTKITAQ
ncbi:MAG: hypothetical protein RIB59_00330, partial [Rhodospirillales bacterium]